MPVRYLYRSYDQATLARLYRARRGRPGDAAARRHEPRREGVRRGAGSRRIRACSCCRGSRRRRADDARGADEPVPRRRHRGRSRSPRCGCRTRSASRAMGHCGPSSGAIPLRPGPRGSSTPCAGKPVVRAQARSHCFTHPTHAYGASRATRTVRVFPSQKAARPPLGRRRRDRRHRLVVPHAWRRRVAGAAGVPARAGGGRARCRSSSRRSSRRTCPIWLEGLGTVAAFQQVTVHAQVDGRLDKVLFTEGQAVKKGDVLAQIDPRPFLRPAASGAGRARARQRAARRTRRSQPRALQARCTRRS